MLIKYFHDCLHNMLPCSFRFSSLLFVVHGCFSSFSVANAEPLYSKGDWLFGLNAAKVFTNETLDSISAGGAPIPGAGVNITDDTTLSFDVSYFLNSSVALNFFGGLPALLKATAVWFRARGLPSFQQLPAPRPARRLQHIRRSSACGATTGAT